MFFTAGLLQLILTSQKKFLSVQNIRPIGLYGVLGGVINGLAGYSMISATEHATAYWEKAILFPSFCVGLIFLCNLWGRWLYKERIPWRANALCWAGIAIGSRG
jgi:hypothetical protein